MPQSALQQPVIAKATLTHLLARQTECSAVKCVGFLLWLQLLLIFVLLLNCAAAGMNDDEDSKPAVVNRIKKIFFYLYESL